jgi:hypothetical protein
MPCPREKSGNSQMTTAKLENNARRSEDDRHLIAGRYRTLDRLGRGRLGEIFAATDDSFEEIGVEHHLAIQIIPDSVVHNNKLFNQLNLGYSKLRTSTHPNIVDYMHFGRDGKFGYLTMELLDGASLRLLLDSAETLPLDEARPVIRSVGEALRFLHAKDVLHGNLTTRNVFITDQLEVRLLDVLPVDPAEPLVRGIGTSSPFGGCTVEDDVFGLACLAYEMLAGKHPFNYTPAAEARSAGLKAEPIDSLPEREWEALRIALSFDDERKISSVADFMREFSIQGTERIRPSSEQLAAQEPVAYPAEEASPVIQPVALGQVNVAEAPVAAVDPVSMIEIRPSDVRQVQKPSHTLRTVFLGMLLAGLSAWTYYGQPEDQIVNLIGYLDERIDLGLAGESDEFIDVSETAPDRIALADTIVPVDQPADAAPAATATATLAVLEDKRSESERTATIDGTVAALAQRTDQLAPAAPPKSGDTTSTSDEETNRTADEISADTDAGSMRTEPALGFTESVISVSERDGVARIAPLGTESLATPLIWWTSEHTANADKDFISVEQQTMADVSVGGSYMLHIPLVNDNLPEPPESFFVNLGHRGPQQGQIERIATVRVDIIDDDLP